MPLRLHSVEFCDFGCFGRKFIDLSGDAVCVVGNNGTGKSTLLSGIYYALTGDLKRLGHSDGAAAVDRTTTQPPFARLTFSPSGDPADVAALTRWLSEGTSRGRRRLVHADRVLTGDEEVARAVSKWIGMPAASVSDFVFVAQGRLSSVLEDPPARRAEILARLFAVDAADRARQAAIEAAWALPSGPDAAVTAEARARAAELEAAAADADRRLSEVPEFPPEVVAGASAVTAAARRRETLLPSLVSARGRVERLRRTAAAEPPPAPGRASQDVESDLRAWAEYRQRAAARAVLLAEADAADREQLELAEPPEPGPAPARPDTSGLALHDAVASCEPDSNCPVCRRPLGDDEMSPTGEFQGFVWSSRAAAADIRDRIARYETESAEHRKRVEARLRYESEVAGLRQKASGARRVAGAAPSAPSVPCPSDADLRSAREAEAFRAMAEAERDAAVRELPEAEAELAALESRVPDEIPEDERLAAEQLVLDAAEASQRRARLSGEATSARRALESNAAVVAAATAAEEAARHAGGWRIVLDGVAAVLHRDAAPAAVVRRRLDEMTAAINESAARLGADFTVAVDAEGNLAARRKGRTLPRLSGGQTAVLALAWRLALSPGLLCLDEPTYGLDDVRIDYLRAAIEAWRDARSGGQLVVVTHERRLVGAFDRVVEL